MLAQAAHPTGLAQLAARLRGNTVAGRIEVVTSRSTRLVLKLPGTGTARFGINRSVSAEAVNTDGNTGYADSTLGHSRVAPGLGQRRINQPSAVFHLIPRPTRGPALDNLP